MARRASQSSRDRVRAASKSPASSSFVVVDVLVVVEVLAHGPHAAVTAVVGGLEGLEQLVAPGLVHGHLVGDQHPVGALELLEVEDLAVDRGRVVHDHDDLGLRIQVAAGAQQQVVELEAAVVGHLGPAYTRSGAGVIPEITQLTLDLGLHVERLLALAGPPLVAGDHELADLLAQPGVGRRRGARERRQLGVDVEPGHAAGLPPGGLGLEHLADLLLRLGRGGR